METTIRIPISKTLKNQAEEAATASGFTSLNQTLRFLIEKLANRELTITTSTVEPIILSARAKKRYKIMEEDFNQHKNVYGARNADDLLKQLRA